MKIEDALKQMNVDSGLLLARFSGNASLLERFIKKFASDKTYDGLCCAMKERDFEKMYEAAHTLKGVAANLGFNELFKICSDFCSHLRNGQTELADQDFALTKKEYGRLVEIISQID